MISFLLFILQPIGKGFRVLVYSVNAKGRGEPHRIDELVIRQSEKYAGIIAHTIITIILSFDFSSSIVILNH